MNRLFQHQPTLLAIVIFNLVSTWLHYSDNAIFLDQYPGPEWFTPMGVWATVIVMTPLDYAVIGYIQKARS